MPPSSQPPSLFTLCEQLCSGEASADTHTALERRQELAADFWALEAAKLPRPELVDRTRRLRAFLGQPNENDPDVRFDQEVGRGQLRALEAEEERRRRRIEAVSRGEALAPARMELLGLVTGIARDLEDYGEASDYRPLLEELIAAIDEACDEHEPGTDRVAHILRRACAAGDNQIEGRGGDWLGAALAFELLTNPFREYGHHDRKADPVTMAQAMRAKRLFYAQDREDRRFTDMAGWPLDMGAESIADLLERHARAARAWSEMGLSDLERERVVAPVIPEEPGRPPASPQVRPQARVSMEASKAGGLSVPLVLPISRHDTVAQLRQLWIEGLPAPEDDEVGVSMYTAPGDPRVRWGAPPQTHRVMAGLACSPEAILTIGHENRIEDEKTYRRLAEQASREAPNPSGYPARLRALLLEAGYKAIGRYDHLDRPTRFPQEVILLDVGPDTVALARESFAGFTEPLPRLRTAVPSALGREVPSVPRR